MSERLKKIQGALRRFTQVKQAARFLRHFYRNLSVKKKLIYSNAFLLCAFAFVSLLAIQITIEIYNQQLYMLSVQSMNEFASGVANDMKDIENFSLDTALNPQVQQQLAENLTVDNEYDEYSNVNTLESILLLHSLSSNYLNSISYVDTHGKTFNIGSNAGEIEQSVQDQLISSAKAADGKYVVLQPDANSRYVYSAQEILEYQNVSLEPLGTLLFRCDLQSIAASHFKEMPSTQTTLFIYSGGRLIFSTGQLARAKFGISSEEQGYQISVIDGKTCYVSYLRSSYPQWTYVSISPYNMLFAKEIAIRNILLASFAVLLIGMVFLSGRTARNITGPLEDLTNSMKQAEHGDFQNIQAELFDYDRTDEVGYLQKDFIKMIRKINVLITEDYRKQLIIKDTEYRALQSQIDPHFLYNTLSTVSWLARTGKTEQISQVTISLGNLMRASISQTSVIQLRDEVDMLQDYINIQRLRYEDRVVFEVDIHEEHLQYAVPKMVLQPIVENAIKYGAEEMLDVCHIRVYSYEEQDRVTVVIEDDGPGLDAKTLCSLRTMTYKPKGTGIGLKNIDDRLKMLFDETSGLRFESGPQVGMKVSFSIPKGGA